MKPVPPVTKAILPEPAVSGRAVADTSNVYRCDVRWNKEVSDIKRGSLQASTKSIVFSSPAKRPKLTICHASERSRSPMTFSMRSEEHTSELQSRGHLVCRLLLEKKKNLEAKQIRASCRLMTCTP